MQGRHSGLWYRAFVLLLCLPAGAVVVWAVRELDFTDVRSWAPFAAVVLVLHAAARRYPLRLVGRNESTEHVTATAFGFALLLIAPLPVAVLGVSLAALVPLRHVSGTVWARTVFEVARAAVMFFAAGWVLIAMNDLLAGETLNPSWQLLLLVLPAGLGAYVVDVIVTASGIALYQGTSLLAVFRQDRGAFDLPTHLLLVGLAPVIVVAGESSLLLAPLLLVALISLYRSSRAAATQHHEALHDALTGLGNRRLLDRRLAALIATAKLDDRFALLLMDLDRFKDVNDQLGHHVGDELLAEVGARMRAMDGVDVAARIGGDEFAFVLRRSASHEALVALGERLIAEVRQPYVVADVRLSIGASIGIALFPDHGLDAPSLLRRADSAMYSAKRAGVPVGFATVQDGGDAPGRVSLLSELEQAMEREQLKLDYQPQVSLTTGAVVAVESLLRWHHPEHGLIPPSAFVTTVEHTELIGKLTRYVIRHVFADIERWARAGVKVPVAINISARDLQHTRFPRDLTELLADRDIDASQVTLEITETALQVDPDRARQILAELRDLGVRLSIDDFGTGYSSLAALRHLPVSEVKIDKSFVLGMAEDAAGSAIVRSIAQLAHALGLTVVAEGVEDDETMVELARSGCDVAQGYLVSRPLPAHLVAPWVRARRQELEQERAQTPFGYPTPPEEPDTRRAIHAV